ncbi:MAG: ATP-binding protein [Alphaproteobacteria bacterium]|nr:ATP-binding protein [Alphaproteobacteria bacterium]
MFFVIFFTHLTTHIFANGYEAVARALANHPELYEFDGDEYWGEGGAQKRLAELEKRKKKIIENDLLFKIDQTLEQIKREDFFTVKGWTPKKKIIKDEPKINQSIEPIKKDDIAENQNIVQSKQDNIVISESIEQPKQDNIVISESIEQPKQDDIASNQNIVQSKQDDSLAVKSWTLKIPFTDKNISKSMLVDATKAVVLPLADKISFTDKNISKSMLVDVAKAVVLPIAEFGILYGLGAFTPLVEPVSGFSSDAARLLAQNSKLIGDKMKQKVVNVGLRGVGVGVDAMRPEKTSIKELVNARADILHALANDPCQKDEERIIRGLDKMQEGMRKKALGVLYKSRFSKDSKSNDFINHCIELPHETKPLPPGPDWSVTSYEDSQKVVGEYIEGLFEKPSLLSNYSKQTQDELKELIKSICDRSQNTCDIEKNQSKYKPSTVPDDTRTSLRYLFYGETGTGKSHAAEEIAKKLDLPYSYLQVFSKEDLSASSLTGKFDYVSPCLGKLVKPFFVGDKSNKKNWKNPILIIDDVDRVIAEPKDISNALLEALSPDTKTLKCEYFGKEVEIDISGLIIIMTANSDLNEMQNQRKGQREFTNAVDKFEAFRDRVKMIKFDDFPVGSKKPILEKFIDDSKLMEYSLNNPLNGDKAKTNRDKLIEFILKYFPHESPRKLRRIAEKLANYFPDYWLEYAKIDTFISLDREEKIKKIKEYLMKNIFFRKIALKKDLNIEDVSAYLALFIMNYFPEIQNFDEIHKKVAKIFPKISDSDEVWFKVLNISPECIKFKSLNDHLLSNDQGEILNWIKDYLKDSAFIKYVYDLNNIDQEEDKQIFVDAIAEIMNGMKYESLFKKLRSVNLYNKKFWPYAIPVSANPENQGEVIEEEEDSSDEEVPEDEYVERDAEKELGTIQYEFWKEIFKSTIS